MSEEIKYEKCTRCKTWRLPSMFLNEVGRKLKTLLNLLKLRGNRIYSKLRSFEKFLKGFSFKSF